MLPVSLDGRPFLIVPSVSLTFIEKNIYVRFAITVFRQIVGISMEANCASPIANLFLYCYQNQL